MSGGEPLADRYQLVEVVGRGGMGEVWSARDLRLSRNVAVKLLSPQMASEAGVRERFDAEARSAARLNHPNVVSVYDSGEHQGTPFLVMELLPGRTLADELAEGPIEPERARGLGLQVLDALAASHRAGVLHRGIKPGNVLISPDGTAKVGDFGIAKSTEGLNLTSTGMIVGTAAYLAPERLAGDPATPRSDLYAVGVVMYEALTGHKPFEADTPMGMMRAVDAHRPVPLAQARPGLDANLAATVERAMAKDPADRFVNADDMAAALQPGSGAARQRAPVDRTVPLHATEVLIPPAPDPGSHRTRPPGRPVAAPGRPGPGGRVGRVALALVGLVVVILVVVLATRSEDSPPPVEETSASTVATPAGGSLPESLDRAITALEDAVQP